MEMKKIEDKILSPEEAAYVRKLIAEHLEYYGLLVGNEKCSPANRERYELVRGLMEKVR